MPNAEDCTDSEAFEADFQAAAGSPSRGPRRLIDSVVRLLVRLLLVFFVTSGLVFTAIHSVPGDPVALRMKNPDPAKVQEIRASLGLDQPLARQYGRYVIGFWRGDWGRSLLSGRPVWEETRPLLAATLELTILALLVGAGGGLGLAFLPGWTGQPRWEWPARITVSLGLMTPVFWIGLLLIFVLSAVLGWFPAGGRVDYLDLPASRTGFLTLDALLAGQWETFGSALHHLVLPVLTLSFYPAAAVATAVRGRLSEPGVQHLLRALRARGLSPSRIWWRHVPWLVRAPVATILGTGFGGLLGGAVLTETVFSWPGLGRYLVEAVLNRDVPVLEHTLLLVLLLALGVSVLSDLVANGGQRAVPAAGNDP